MATRGNNVCLHGPKRKRDQSICTRMAFSLKWRHSERHDVSNHQYLDYLLRRLQCTSKKTWKLRATGRCEENPAVTVGFLSQWRLRALKLSPLYKIFFCVISQISFEFPRKISFIHTLKDRCFIQMWKWTNSCIEEFVSVFLNNSQNSQKKDMRVNLVWTPY